jgi:uncharacterized lipoprotein
MKTVAAVAAIALLALAGCSSAEGDSAPTLTDAQLTTEYLEAVRHMTIENVAGGPEAAQKTVATLVNNNCELMRNALRDELISTDPAYPTNATWIEGVRAQMATSTGQTTGQMFNAFKISAKYKCPEFTSMLQLFEAVHGIN